MKYRYTINENAKDDWLKLVKKHKRKQKGLTALSTLNTNAGNVEYNVSMFNKMNSPVDGPSTNPVSGPFSTSDVSSGMGESLSEAVVNNDTIELEYENIPVEVVTRYGDSSGYYSAELGAYLPDDDDTEERLIDWTYEVDKQEIIEFLQDNIDVQNYLDPEGTLSDEEYYQKLTDNFEELLSKHMHEILVYFEERAIEDAQENYEEFVESYDSKKNVYENFDDKFDLSLRTLL